MAVDDAKLVEELAEKLQTQWLDGLGYLGEARAALAFCRSRIPALLGMTGDEMVKQMSELLIDCTNLSEKSAENLLRTLGILPPPAKTPGEEFADGVEELVKERTGVGSINPEIKLAIGAFYEANIAKAEAMARGAK